MAGRKMRAALALTLPAALTALSLFGCATAGSGITERSAGNETLVLIDGGRLYDNWQKELNLPDPEGDHPLWKLQSTNKRTGNATWRCKECHGWDYKGKDGAYASGSHQTGFPGVLPSRSKSIEAIEAILKGAANAEHDFSGLLSDDSIHSIAVFIQKGTFDLQGYLDYSSKTPYTSDSEKGKEIYHTTKCYYCHGEDGGLLSKYKDEYIGVIARTNPWEFIHKTRFGEPGEIMPALKIKLPSEEKRSRMPSGVGTGYDLQDMLNLLAYTKSLSER